MAASNSLANINSQTALKRGAKSRIEGSSASGRTIDQLRYNNQKSSSSISPSAGPSVSSPFNILEKDEEGYDEVNRPSNATSGMDPSDISDLDLLAQTQMSNNLMGGDKNARSHLGLNDFTRSHITADVNGQSRMTSNNLFKRMDDAESLAMTPDKDMGDRDSNTESWIFGQKSYLTNNKSAIERTVDSQLSLPSANNPVNKLKAKIKE
jgi:hypothetical protein